MAARVAEITMAAATVVLRVVTPVGVRRPTIMAVAMLATLDMASRAIKVGENASRKSRPLPQVRVRRLRMAK